MSYKPFWSHWPCSAFTETLRSALYLHNAQGYTHSLTSTCPSFGHLVHIGGHPPTMVCAIKYSKGKRETHGHALLGRKKKNGGLFLLLGTFSSFNATSYFLANNEIASCTLALSWSNRCGLLLVTCTRDKNPLLMQAESCYHYRTCSSELLVSLLD